MLSEQRRTARGVRGGDHHGRVSALLADLGPLDEHSRVSVEISAWANVRLMVAECAVLKQFGYGYVFYGGLYRPGRVTLAVPYTEHWVLVVDLEGLVGTVTASPIHVEPPRRRRFAVA